MTSAFCLLALWFPAVLNDALLLVAYTLVALALHLFGRHLETPPEQQMLAGAGHLAMTLLNLWVADRLVTPDFELEALADLGLIAALVAASFLFGATVSLVYLFTAHIALLFWLWSTLGPVTEGQALVSVAWGLYAVALLLTGLRLDRRLLRALRIERGQEAQTSPRFYASCSSLALACFSCS